MIVAGSASPLLLSSAGGYNLTKSLRFRSSASAYLNRTPAGSPTSTQKFTQSYWVKRGTLSTTQYIYNCEPSDWVRAYIFSDNILYFDIRVSGTNYSVGTTQVFRDPSAWYHIVVSVDTTQATAANRVVIYINGVQAPTNTPTIPQNSATVANSANPNFIGAYKTPNQYFDGYLAELNFIDGQALTPSSFGSTNAATGVWQPIKYTGTYGTNGFYLPFTDVATTSGSNAGLGKDFSGNSNYWTTNNISVTTGTTYDSMSDVPTLTSATAANYAVLNPLDTGGTAPSSANLELIAGAAERGVRSTFAIPTTGLYYAEAVVGTNQSGATDIAFGFVARTTNLSANPSGISNGWLCYATATTNITRNGTSTLAGAGTALVSGDVLQLAIDLANNKGWLGKNNTWFNGTTGTDGNPSTGANPTFTFSSPPELFVLAHCYSSTINVNFGQRPFAYTPPTGFVALNTFNLPTPTIGATASTQAGKYFNAVLYTGNGSTNAITGVGFQPDFVWGKSRSNATSNFLYDAVRGVYKRLISDSTAAETDETGGGLSSFNSDGFTVQANSTENGNARTFVAWNWKANGSGSTNTAGSITSTVSANTTAGFSIVTFNAGTAGNKTVGHGLGVKPAMVIFKDRTTTSSWLVWHQSLSSQTQSYLILQTTAASVNDSRIWANTAPTSTVLSFESGYSFDINDNIVAYCFAQVAGYSAFGSYTGNGSTNGTFVYTGFRPRFIMIKRTDTTANWFIFDTARDTYNAAGLELYPNLSNAEADGRPDLDILSNGMKMRSTATGQNASGGTYIYAAFAEVPYKFSNAR